MLKVREVWNIGMLWIYIARQRDTATSRIDPSHVMEKARECLAGF